MQSSKIVIRRSPATPSFAQALAARDAWFDAGIAFLCILPLLLTAHLPLNDATNHLARQYVLRDWASSPALQNYYYIHWALVPNLAMELFTLALRWALPLPVILRLFCIGIVLLLFFGTRMVNRQLAGPTSRVYRAAPVLCWGGPIQYGFLNYCFGVGLDMVLFGVWLRLRQGPLALRAAFLLAAGALLMLCHLAAFALFAIAVGMTELLDRRRRSRLPVPVVALTVVFLVFALLSPTSGDAAVGGMAFGTLVQKVRSLASITYYTSPKMEGALLLAILGGLAVALATRTVRWNWTGLAIVAVMGLMWLAAPISAMGAFFIDYRLPWAISFFALASLVPGEGRWARPLGWWFAFLSVARIAIIATLWLRWEPVMASIDGAMSQLPQGARMMVVLGAPGPNQAYRDPDLTHASAFAVIRRQAYIPNLFASLPGQILFFQPHYKALRDQGGFLDGAPSSLATLPPDYDYVLELYPDSARVAPGLPLAAVASGPHFRLMKVVRQGSQTGPRTG